jgi:hypothetical protein
MHPLIENLEKLKDSQLEAKISDLTSKYFMATNQGVKSQIALLLQTYTEHRNERSKIDLQKSFDSRNKDLDNLIHIS